MTKPYKGIIRNWTKLGDPNETALEGSPVMGMLTKPDGVRDHVRTSRVVTYEPETGFIETVNSRYLLIPRTREEIDPSPITERTRPNEPTFTLRGQDIFAPSAIRHWSINLAKKLGPDHPKVRGALAIAKEMEDWTQRYGGKVPD